MKHKNIQIVIYMLTIWILPIAFTLWILGKVFDYLSRGIQYAKDFVRDVIEEPVVTFIINHIKETE